MAQVLSPNIQPTFQQLPQPDANRSASLSRSLVFKYYIHDSVSTLRFQLIGDLRNSHLAELQGSWETARTTLSARRLLLDVSHLYSADNEGREWLGKMEDAGALFLPDNYLKSSAGHPTQRLHEQGESVRLSILGRVLGRFRGVRQTRPTPIR